MNEESTLTRQEKVLVVDDSRQIREFLTDYVLKPRGYGVYTADDGLKGLRIAFDKHPDLMIVDVQMPNMGGFELLRRVQLRRLNIPAILITAHGSEKVAVEALRLGVRDYVLKPFDVADMEEAIDRALRESRLEGAQEELQQQLERQSRYLRQCAQQINTLSSLGKFLASDDEDGSLPQRVVEAAAYLATADQSALYSLDRKHEELTLLAVHNMPLAPKTLSLRVGPAGHALRRRETVIIDNKTIPQVFPNGDSLQNLAYVPLFASARPVGLLNVATSSGSHTFSQRDRRLLDIIASMVASALSD